MIIKPQLPLLCLLAIGLAAAKTPCDAADAPNILMIMVDDLGYGDLSSYGAKDLRSPNIDALALKGLVFSNFYANCPVCSPSRASLMTGRYPELVGVPGVIRTHAENSWGDLADDAVLLPAEPGKPREIATVGRHGRFEILTLDGGVPEWRTVHAVPMGMGRLSVREDSTPDAIVAYTVADEGRVWRHERDASRHWHTELIYVGDQGMRGCAAGRFDADPTVETVAVYGYFKRVELLSKRDDGWHVETLFVDRDKGHWIARGEFDGRNGTDELVATGYSGRIVLLSRPPGYGLPGVLTAEREQAGK